jgi:hypothetical protein
MPSRFFYATQDVCINGQTRKSFVSNRIMSSDLPELVELAEKGIVRFTDYPTVPVKHDNATIQVAPEVHIKNQKKKKAVKELPKVELADPVEYHDQEEEVLP